jgi:hypothetical protein
MTSRSNLLLKLWPWLLIIAVLSLGLVLASCAPAPSAAAPTPTKPPRPEMTATPVATDPAASSPQTVASAPTEPQAGPATAEPTKKPAANATVAETNTPEPPSPTPKPASALPSVSSGDVMGSPDYGVQGFLWWKPEVADRDLGLIKDAGFHWVKQLFSWQDIEGAGKGKYDWTNADRVVDQPKRRGSS